MVISLDHEVLSVNKATMSRVFNNLFSRRVKKEPLAILQLNPQKDYLGEGFTRVCYRHPSDRTKCIKIWKKRNQSTRRDIKIEIKELRRLSKRKRGNILIPFYHGTVITSIGEGYIFDLITDALGDPAKSLKEHLLSHRNGASKILDLLLVELLKKPPVITDLNLGNFLVTVVNEEVTFSVIDGFGEKRPIKMTAVFPSLARLKIKRKFPALREEWAALKMGNKRK